MTWVDITERTPFQWAAWLDGIGECGIDWRWNDDSSGHYFLCFARPEDALAFKLTFNV